MIAIRQPGPLLSVVVPALNESPVIGSTLASLAAAGSDEIEIIVVDGGSTDRTADIARQTADLVLVKSGGRAIQMNHGAEYARGAYLMFLHADTRMPPNFLEVLKPCLQRECAWGRFDIQLSGGQALFRIVEFWINLRSRITGIATGDQCIFVRRALFRELGGYPEIPIMEDIALSNALKRISRPLCLRQQVITSSRRWEQHGIVRTILLMWCLRLRYFLGADPRRLVCWYH